MDYTKKIRTQKVKGMIRRIRALISNRLPLPTTDVALYQYIYGACSVCIKTARLICYLQFTESLIIHK